MFLENDIFITILIKWKNNTFILKIIIIFVDNKILLYLCRSIIYGRLGVDIANAIVASIFPFESAWKADSKLLSPFHMIVNESLWIVQKQEDCLKKMIATKKLDFGNDETFSVLTLAKQLTALSIAHEVIIFYCHCF